jgi:hypothetical protein
MEALMTILLSFTALPTSSFSDMVNLNRCSLQIFSSTLRDLVDGLIFDFLFIPHIPAKYSVNMIPCTVVLLINLVLRFQTVSKTKTIVILRACS